MRIGFVVEGGFDRSGRERVVPALLWLALRLARRHQVEVFALRHEAKPSTYPLVGATIHDLGGFRPRLGPGALWMLPALVREMRRVGPLDVIHAHLAGAPGALAVLAGRILGTPVLVALADGELTSLPEIAYGLERRWRGRCLAAIALRGAQQVTAPSEFAARPARERGYEVEMIPLGVDTASFAPLGRVVEGPPWRLVQVASLSRVKDQATLLAALRLVVDREPRVHLDLVGEDTLRGTIQRRRAELGLEAQVTLHGFLPSDRVRDLLQAAHLYVQSSRHEAAGVAVLEAAACGVPTVGTRVGYVADWAPERALAVEVGDPPALAAGVLDLLLDGPRRLEMARRARAVVLAQDADWVAARMEGLYEGLRSRRVSSDA
jgi:glycosyltransferase involved in cell wall biosynthesis